MLRNTQKHQNIQGLPSKSLELAAILENGGKLKNSDYIFFIQEKNKRNVPLFSKFNLQEHNCGLLEWNTLYRNESM